MFFLRVGDLHRRGVAFRFERFDFGDDAAAIGFELEEAIEIDIRAAIFQRGAIGIRVFAEIFAGKHGARF